LVTSEEEEWWDYRGGEAEEELKRLSSLTRNNGQFVDTLAIVFLL